MIADFTDALNQLERSRTELADNLNTKGVSASASEHLTGLVPKVLDIQGGGSGEWCPPAGWPDIKKILQEDTTPGFGGKYIQLITDHYDTINLTGALAYRTSDGAFYSANTTHTWDRLQDVPSTLGYKTRLVIYYTNASSAIDLQPTCLWVVLDLTLLSLIGTRRFLRAFEFINNKNLSPTITSVSGMLFSCSSLAKVPDVLNISNSTNTSNMFYYCTCLTKVPDVLNLSNSINTGGMFLGCSSLTKLPDVLDISLCTNANNMFSGCQVLTKVPDMLDVSSCIDTTNMFANAGNIKNLRLRGLKVSTNISASPFYTRDDLLFTITNLQTVTNETLTIGTTNMAKLTSGDIAIATSKGWTLA